jgi:hypothetical protein
MKRTNEWFLIIMNHQGKIDMTVLMIIPYILYFSKSIITKPNRLTGGTALYSIHITPFVSFSVAWRNN